MSEEQQQVGATELNPNLSEKAVKDYALVKDAVENGDQKAYAELMLQGFHLFYVAQNGQ
jgi:hypothetical protein